MLGPAFRECWQTASARVCLDRLDGASGVESCRWGSSRHAQCMGCMVATVDAITRLSVAVASVCQTPASHVHSLKNVSLDARRAAPHDDGFDDMMR
eukprot:264466-Pyramimonas_sp.AAC.1